VRARARARAEEGRGRKEWRKKERLLFYFQEKFYIKIILFFRVEFVFGI